MVYVMHATSVALRLQYRPDGDECCRAIAKRKQREHGPLTALAKIISEPLARPEARLSPARHPRFFQRCLLRRMRWGCGSNRRSHSDSKSNNESQ